MAKIREGGDKVEIAAAEATTKRLKVANDARKDQRDSNTKADANADSRAGTK